MTPKRSTLVQPLRDVNLVTQDQNGAAKWLNLCQIEVQFPIRDTNGFS